ncbi:MAG: A24 family peptidase C-terminal domain-containing protein [Sulfolobaceae archaeon]
MLVHTSILDLKYREVDPKIWLYYSPLCIFIIFDYHYLFLPLYLYSFAVTNLLFYLLYRFSLIGGADLFLNIILGLSNSSVFPLFFSKFSVIGLEPLIIILYSSILILLLSIGNLIKQYKYTKNLPLFKKVILAMSAKRISVREFLSSKFLFPLTEIKEDGSIIIRDFFSIEEDDAYWRNYYMKLVKEGKVSENQYIWVAWGIPVIPFIFLGYLLSLIIGFPL